MNNYYRIVSLLLAYHHQIVKKLIF